MPYGTSEIKLTLPVCNAPHDSGEVITLTKRNDAAKVADRKQKWSGDKEKILQAVWGYNVYPATRTIDNFILNFRKYFEEDSRSPKYFHFCKASGISLRNRLAIN